MPHLTAAARAPAIDPVPAPPKRYLPEDSAARKTFPMMTGLLDYFPDALAAVAHHSFVSNEKHNPGLPVHWARDKSGDHADCIVRHLVERDLVGVAWRALALLQEHLEREHGFAPPRNATPLP